jgi:glycosyltransferase involved in cell wall biosynthesis
MKKLIIVIPAFNEEETISEVLKQIPDFSSIGYSVQAVVIDDGSKDKTAELARANGAEVIEHKTNMGVGKSFQDGVQYALQNEADIMVNIDADLQYDPADIQYLIQPIVDGQADFVTADRFSFSEKNSGIPENMSAIKYWGNHQMSRLVNQLAGTDLQDVSSGFRAINREAILNLNLTGKYTYTHESILNLAFKNLRIASVPINVRYFKERKSKVAGNLLKYIFRSLTILYKAYRDYKPFNFFGLLSMIAFFPGVVLSILLLVHYVLTGAFTPYKFVGFIGIYLVSLGLILLIIGFLADIMVGMRMTLEKELYLLKRLTYPQRVQK